ncbi:MAG: hypothetical protein KA140_01520 [Caldisericia bacterium]|nr:hypothetical protein [Caldisericia bacterium]
MEDLLACQKLENSYNFLSEDEKKKSESMKKSIPFIVLLTLFTLGFLVLLVYQIFLMFYDPNVEYRTFPKKPGEVLGFINDGYNPLLIEKNRLVIYDSPLLNVELDFCKLSGKPLDVTYQLLANKDKEFYYVYAISKQKNDNILDLIRINYQSKSWPMNSDEIKNTSKMSIVFSGPIQADGVIGVINDNNDEYLIVCRDSTNNSMSFYDLSGHLKLLTSSKDNTVYDIFRDFKPSHYKLYSFDGSRLNIYDYKDNNLIIRKSIAVTDKNEAPARIANPKYFNKSSRYLAVASDKKIHFVDIYDYKDEYKVKTFDVLRPISSVDNAFLLTPNNFLYYSHVENEDLKTISFGPFRLLGWDNRNSNPLAQMIVTANDARVFAYNGNAFGKFYVFRFETEKLVSGNYFYHHLNKTNIENGLYLYSEKEIYFISQDELERHHRDVDIDH